MKEKAKKLLEEMTSNQNATFHEGQWEAINSSVNEQKQLLVVQRTGWGKSAVYFIATKLRRDQGYGPTIIISPLLSLIRNQIEAGEKLGLNVVSYNSSMSDEALVYSEYQILNKRADAIIIAPEQLGQTYFSEKILSEISNNIGMFVVDEAHCISDWGHDFRTDYQRIVRFLNAIPQNIPVLATTATANDRVIDDIKKQLSKNLTIIRGPLIREALRLQNMHISSTAERLSWLVKNLPNIKGTGIIYAKTIKDCEILAEFLRRHDIDAHAYHGQIESHELKIALERQLIDNQIKALVATSALGMGFDKPDLSFVIHYQAPGNIVEYYQQVGRAGRGIDSALGIMMLGEEDFYIQSYFIDNSFPKEDDINTLLDTIEKYDGIKATHLESLINFSQGKINKILKFLSNENPSPIFKDVNGFYCRTQFDYSLPIDKIERLNTTKKREWNTLLEYHQSTECLMQFLSKELNDPFVKNCGKCINCDPTNTLSEEIDKILLNDARYFLRHRYVSIKPRSMFASSNRNAQLAFPNYGFSRPINSLKCEIGYALSSWKDGGWGNLVAQGKRNNNFSDELIAPMIKMINSIPYTERPTWITYIPSPRHPNLVKNFAFKLAQSLGIPCLDTILINEIRPPQKTMENSFYQSKNLDGAFSIDESNIYTNPVWLIDDAVDSGWTFTIAGALLRQVGVSKVMPLALTSTKRNG